MQSSTAKTALMIQKERTPIIEITWTLKSELTVVTKQKLLPLLPFRL